MKTSTLTIIFLGSVVLGLSQSLVTSNKAWSNLKSSYFNPNNLLINNNGIILKTIDGGNTWTNQFTLNSYNLNSVFFINMNVGFAVGNIGTIIKTKNGGEIGISELPNKMENTFIYPNPTSDKLYINLLSINDFQNTTVSIYDLQGQLLINQTVYHVKTGINISHLSKGVYIIKLNTIHTKYFSKFVKE